MLYRSPVFDVEWRETALFTSTNFRELPIPGEALGNLTGGVFTAAEEVPGGRRISVTGTLVSVEAINGVVADSFPAEVHMRFPGVIQAALGLDPQARIIVATPELG